MGIQLDPPVIFCLIKFLIFGCVKKNKKQHIPPPPPYFLPTFLVSFTFHIAQNICTCMLASCHSNQEVKKCTEGVCVCVSVCVLCVVWEEWGGGDRWAHLLASEHLFISLSKVN